MGPSTKFKTGIKVYDQLVRLKDLKVGSLFVEAGSVTGIKTGGKTLHFSVDIYLKTWANLLEHGNTRMVVVKLSSGVADHRVSPDGMVQEVQFDYYFDRVDSQ
jgi:hypothetical protein